jgi:hypothetical protein
VTTPSTLMVLRRRPRAFRLTPQSSEVATLRDPLVVRTFRGWRRENHTLDNRDYPLGQAVLVTCLTCFNSFG